jgi:hypothetical protein
LANTRTDLHDRLLLLRRDLDIGRHIVRSTEDHPFEWITVAFMIGWLLSRLPARKQKIYYSIDQEQGKVRSNKKKKKFWKMVWNASKTRDCRLSGKETCAKGAEWTGPAHLIK